MKLELGIALVSNVHCFVFSVVVCVINRNNNSSCALGANSVPGIGMQVSASARHLSLGIQGELDQHNPYPFCHKDTISVS